MTEQAKGTRIRRRQARARSRRCPRCGRSLAHRNQSHFCGSPRDLAAHLAGKPPGLKLLFAHLLEEIRACGPVTVLSERTRIAFRTGMAFMAVAVQQAALVGHLILPGKRRHPRFLRVDTLAPHNHAHHFRLTTSDEIDPEFVNSIHAAYAVGRQRARDVVTLTLAVESVDGRRPVPLEPVMGAFAHLVAFDEARSGFAHIHPQPSDLNRRPDAYRPQLTFRVQIPRAGRYVIWSQFKTGGREHFAPFWFEVSS